MAAKTTTQTVPKGKTFNLYGIPSDWSISGYDFLGWDTNPNVTAPTYGGSASISGGFSNDVQLYAIWQSQDTPPPPGTQYTVTFNGNGGEGAMASQSYVSGTVVVLPGCDFSKNSYAFSSWNTSPDGTGASYQPGSRFTITSNVTLYAMWTSAPSILTVNFNSNGGSGNMQSDSYSSGATVIFPECTFTPAQGYEFVNWATRSDGSGLQFSPGDTIGADDLYDAYGETCTLYATWYKEQEEELPTPENGKVLFKTSAGEWKSVAARVTDHVVTGFPPSDYNIVTIIIPSKDAEGYDITGISLGRDVAAYSLRDSLFKIVLPDTLTEIGDHAFDGFEKLRDVTIPTGVTTIGTWAFRNTGIENIVIPRTVTSLGTAPFNGCTKLARATVYSVPARLFSGCSALTNVTIGSNVTSIGPSAFSYCGLVNVVIPNSVTNIGAYAFRGCSSLMSVTIPNSVTSIGTLAFDGCAIASLTLPSSVNDIGYYAFHMSGLNRVTFQGKTSTEVAGMTNYRWGMPESTWIFTSDFPAFDPSNPFAPDGKVVYRSTVDDIWHIADANLYSDGIIHLKKNFDDGVFQRTITDAILPTRDENGVAIVGVNGSGCPNLETVVVPNGYTYVESFDGCPKLSKVTLPNSVTAFGSWAFQGCTSLVSLSIPNSVTTIGQSAFKGCTSLASLTIPNSVTNVGEWAFSRCPALSSVVLGSGMTELPECVFQESGLVSVTIPDNITSIRRYAFYQCVNLETVVIGNGVTTIENAVFMGCTNLRNVTIGSNVVSLGGSSLFSGCTSLTDITIPASVTYIGSSAFSRCDNIVRALFVDKTMADIQGIQDGLGEFKYPWGLNESAIVPGQSGGAEPLDDGENYTETANGVKYTFKVVNGNSIIEKNGGTAQAIDTNTSGTLHIPGRLGMHPVTGIGQQAFFRCMNLTGVTVPSTVTSIGRNAFYGCTGLTSVDLQMYMTPCTIGLGAFSVCTSLPRIRIPAGVTSIGEGAFDDCGGLTSVDIPVTVVTIGKNAFYHDYSMESVKFWQRTLEQIPNIPDEDGVNQYPWGLLDPEVIIPYSPT